MKYYVGTTRFNNFTWNENLLWRERKDYKGCIYGVPIKINETIQKNIPIFIIEMNNEMNKIMGIGLIKNRTINNMKARIYSDRNYNRFIYKGYFHVHNKQFDEYEKKIIGLFEILLFKGKKQCKRHQGISLLPKWIMKNDEYEKKIKQFFKEIYDKYNI